MTYWIMYAFVQVLDKTCRLKQRIGASSHVLLKTLAMVWLMTPRTRPGALVFYNRFLQPFLKRYEPLIDVKIDQAQVKTLEIIQEFQEDPKEALNKHMIAAQKSQLVQQVTKELQKQQQQFIQLVHKSLEKSKPLLQQVHGISGSKLTSKVVQESTPVFTKDQNHLIKSTAKAPGVRISSRRTTVAKDDTIQWNHPQKEKEQTKEQVKQVKDEVEVVIHTQLLQEQSHEEIHRAENLSAKKTDTTMTPEISAEDEIGLPLEEENNHTVY
jgi:hypothetical protein